MSETDCPLDHFFRRIRTAIHDVLAHRAMQQRRVLRNHADACAKRILRDLGNILPINQDAAFLKIVETQQQIDERGFTRTGTSN
ncbi:hypothetical protein D3C80_1913040 [compost metagenome]